MSDILLSESDQKRLLEIARDSLTAYLSNGSMPRIEETSPALQCQRGVFVTLKKRGELRGCIGDFQSSKPLYHHIAEMVIQSATSDPRFAPVTAEELPELEIDISVLSPRRTISDINEISIGTHGIYITKGYHRGVLLPQVAVEYGWDRETFLEHTCWKAGLPKDAWKKGATIEIFAAEVFGE